VIEKFFEIFDIMQDSVRFHCDSHSAIFLAKDHRYHKRTKHIDVRYHKYFSGL